MSTPAKKRGGRPSKFTPELRRRVLRLISKGIPHKHAALAAGCSYQSLLNYQQAYPDFAERCKNALADGIRRRVEAVEECCRSKDEAVRLRAATWWLTHVPGAAEHFSETRKTEFTGLDGSIIAAGVTLYLPRKELPALDGTVAMKAITERSAEDERD